METVQLKIEYENALRRASVPRNETLAKLKATIAALIGVRDCSVKYRDDENDLITIGSDLELQDVLTSASKGGKALRLIVSAVEDSSTPAASAQEQQQQQTPPPPPQEPEIPWVHLARALSDPQVVTRIQQVLQSPIITETVNRASRAYVDAKGDILIAGLTASQQIPMLFGLLAELLEELPVLKDLQTLVMTWFANGGPRGAMGGGPRMPFPFFGGGFPFAQPHGPHHGPHHHQGHHPHEHHGHGPNHHHGHGPHHHGPHHPHEGPQFKQKHFGVSCDGCLSDPALKQVSVAAGHHTRRGFINGLRFKSQSIHDFDLCESCKASDRFPDRAYGPFNTMQAPPQPACRGGGGGGGGGRGCWWRPSSTEQQANWRGASAAANASEPEKQQPAEPAAKRTPPPPQAANQFDWMEAFGDVIKKGTDAFVEATKNDSSDMSELARALAESLKDDSKPASVKTTTATAVPYAEPQSEAPPSPTKDGEWVPVASPVAPASDAEDPFVKWTAQLAQLQTLGFEELETYIEFLEQEKGDLDRVVNRIVRRDA